MIRFIPAKLPPVSAQKSPYIRRRTQHKTILLNPTFFTNWIGGNDVLSYATGGGALADDPLTPTIDESLLNTAASDNYGASNDNVFGYNKNDIREYKDEIDEIAI